MHVRRAAPGRAAPTSEPGGPRWRVGGRGDRRPSDFYPTGRGLKPFQMKAAAAGSCCPDLEYPGRAPEEQGAGSGSKGGGGSNQEPHLRVRGGFP